MCQKKTILAYIDHRSYLHIYHIVEKKEKRIYVKQYIFNQNLLHNKKVWYKCTFEVYSILL